MDTILKGDRVVSNKKICKWFFAYLCLICIIGQNWQKFKVHKTSHNIKLWTFVDFDRLCKSEKKGGWNKKKIFSSETTEPIFEGPNRTNFWKRTIQWLFHQNLVLIEQMVSDEDFLWEFPIGSYVKLSSAVVAILVGGLKCQTQFWKGPKLCLVVPPSDQDGCTAELSLT
jgi:hypothetical protein